VSSRKKRLVLVAHKPSRLRPEVSALQHARDIVSSATFRPTECLTALSCFVRWAESARFEGRIEYANF
jgi:hypothetical protein